MSNAGAAKLKTHLWNLRGLTGTGGTGNDHNLVVTNGSQNLVPALTNRQISRIGYLQRRFIRAHLAMLFDCDAYPSEVCLVKLFALKLGALNINIRQNAVEPLWNPPRCVAKD